MKKNFKTMIELYLKEKRNVSFSLDEIEEYALREAKTMNVYIDLGGSEQLKQDILALQSEEKIEPIKARKKEVHRTLLLPNHWRKIKQKVEEQWERSFVFKSMEVLDVSYFVNHPDQQTAKNRDRLHALYTFMKGRASRDIVTAEERMYELFHKEKWLSPDPHGENGKEFLGKLKLDVNDLKARKFPEPIPYETRNHIALQEVQTVLIIENNSFYHSVRRSLETLTEIAGIPVDMIVYARGKQTIANLEYLYTLFEEAAQKTYYYVGDIDPEGISIYANVSRKYEELNIKIAKGIYGWMLREEDNPPEIEKDQQRNREDFDYFLRNFANPTDDFYRTKLEQLWNSNTRIPQEVTNYEKLLRKGWEVC